MRLLLVIALVFVSVNFYGQNNPEIKCDQIVLKDGRILKGNIAKIDRTEIRYTKCDGDDYHYIVAKKTVEKIVYSGGKEIIFLSRKESRRIKRFPFRKS